MIKDKEDLEDQKKNFFIISDILPQKTKFPKSGLFNGRIRFNILMNIIICVFIIVPQIAPQMYSVVISCYFCFQWLIYFILYLINTIKIINVDKQNDKCKLENFQLSSSDQILFENQASITFIEKAKNIYKYKHIMMTFIYNEPLELLINTLDNLQKMHGSDQLIVAVGFEERTQNKEEKIVSLKHKFSKVFEELIITIHPFGIEGEIPGKCSNCNYVQRQIIFHLKKTRIDFNINNYMLTNLDTDTRFQKNYLQILEKQIQETCKGSDDVRDIIWQPVLYYNWDLQKRNFFVRITSVIRNMLMMSVLIPFQINVMSVFTFSLKLCEEGEYTHPAYQMEDIICYIRWFIKKKKQIQIRAVYSPTLSGPTSGNTFFQQLFEWATQLKRWVIGSAEVFHYFIVHSKQIQPNFKYTLWGLLYFNYYALFLIGQNLFIVSLACSFFLNQEKLKEQESYVIFATLCLSYIIYILVFIVNEASQYLLEPIREKEQTNIFQTIVNIVFTPITMILYSLIAFYGLFEVLIKGKRVCNHIASKKEELK